ncbi:hypothetical protein B0H13DRAFT_1952881 [Mycena leptocephala]|nr:hypothetical protein B0H13DRAFT_1952881 [Mycena leptocephala]
MLPKSGSCSPGSDETRAEVACINPALLMASGSVFEHAAVDTIAPSWSAPVRTRAQDTIEDPLSRTSFPAARGSVVAGSPTGSVFVPTPKRTRRRAVTRITRSLELPDIPSVTDSNLPAPANSAGISPAYWPLLRLGCTVLGRGMACNIDGCLQTTKNFADMGRHVPAVHFPQQVKSSCEGCPRTFSRRDALKRHVDKKPRIFSDLPCVGELKDNCPSNRRAYTKLNTSCVLLFAKFEALFKARH